MDGVDRVRRDDGDGAVGGGDLMFHYVLVVDLDRWTADGWVECGPRLQHGPEIWSTTVERRA